MPGGRLRLSYAEIIAILEKHDFALKRQNGSHRTYEGYVNDRRRVVQVSPHKLASTCPAGTLNSIIRQSGLTKKAFRGDY